MTDEEAQKMSASVNKLLEVLIELGWDLTYVNNLTGGYWFVIGYPENLGDIKDAQGGTIEIADKYGWARAIYHEIFNLHDY